MIKRIISIFTLSLISLLGMISVTYAYSPVGDVCYGRAEKESAACVSESPGKDPLSGEDGIILRAVDIVSYVAGVAAVIVIVYSGIKLASSRGDAQKISNARGTLQDALVGLIVIALANVLIVYFVKELAK